MTKSRAGFVTATVALVTMGCKIAVIDNRVFQGYSACFCIGLGVAGFLAWCAGRWGEVRRARAAKQRDAADQEVAGQDPLAFLRSAKYWGIIMMLSAAIATGVLVYKRPQYSLPVYARMTITNVVTVTNIITLTNEKPAVRFPALRLEGVVVNGPQSSAVINGRVLRVGEMIGDVALVAVDSAHAFVALEGQTNVLALRR